jgi:4-hydroxy-tetrahydrodipicolinate reductase
MKIALLGYGRMGRAVETVATARGHEIVVRLDIDDNPDGRGLTRERLAGAEVAIEFTTAEAAPRNVEGLAECGVNAVVGTTGWYDRLGEVSSEVERMGVGLIYAPNFSLGTQVFFRLAALAAELAERLNGYDAYVLEAHHRHKRDHPSGTAAKVADLLVSTLSSKTRWKAGTDDSPIDPTVLQVTSVRAGEIPGAHVVGLEGPHDRLEIRHEARARTGFAEGAVRAAEWVRGRRGVFTLEDMLAELWS